MNLRKTDKCIECKNCSNWIHLKCSLLNSDAFEEHVKCEEKPWTCSRCTASILPFNFVDDNDLFLENLELSCVVSSDLNIIPSNELDDFLTESNNLSNTVNESQPDEFPHIIKLKYYVNHSFNHIKPDSSSTRNFAH